MTYVGGRQREGDESWLSGHLAVGDRLTAVCPVLGQFFRQGCLKIQRILGNEESATSMQQCNAHGLELNTIELRGSKEKCSPKRNANRGSLRAYAYEGPSRTSEKGILACIGVRGCLARIGAAEGGFARIVAGGGGGGGM